MRLEVLLAWVRGMMDMDMGNSERVYRATVL